MTVEDRIYTLSYLWKEADYNYAFRAKYPEIDWDGEYKRFLPLVMAAKDDFEFYCLLMKFYALLRDGHTCVVMPQELLSGRSVPFSVIRELPLGGTMYLATTWSKLVDGSEFVNVGIAPDIPVEKTTDDLKNGTDVILKKGLEFLRS